MATPKPLREDDARSTYRYLRVGMVLAVVLLATSILIQHAAEKTGCWQTSISAYYYTPVRAIFVGGMMAIGFGLVVIKGRSTAEDIFLNLAGMFAPVVAVAPTADGDTCLRFGQEKTAAHARAAKSVAQSVIDNIDNNMKALLIVGFLGLAISLVLAIVVNRSVKGPVQQLRRGTRISAALTLAALLLAWWTLEAKGDFFYSQAHGIAAVAMFVMLIGAVACKALEKRWPANVYFKIYASLAGLMAVGGIAIKVFSIGGAHTIFVLEAWEIALFAVFWIVQTRENWDEEVTSSGDTAATTEAEPLWPWQLAGPATSKATS